MLLYTNHTRFAAIVTVKIESSQKPSEAIMIGSEAFLEKITAKLGHWDFFVDGGQELHLGENTVATLMSVRSVP
ncbi:MAG: hypothetical protein V9G21_00855 [Methylotenera sp.]|jgi:hypothetical protein